MPMQVQGEDGGVAPTHFQPSTKRRWVVSTTHRPLYLLARPGSYCTGGWVGLGASLDGTENLASQSNSIRRPLITVVF